MKARLNPTEITLRDLPPDGREFVFTRESGELNSSLADLIGENPYEARLKITPMGNAFDLTGEIKTDMGLQCSICASDFQLPVKQSVHELIVPQKPMSKGDQQTRTNHAHEWSEGGPDYILLESDTFNVAEYVHEVVALAEPIRPICRPTANDSCENEADRVQREWLSYGAQDQTSIRANPFQVLEKMKLKG